MDRRELIRQGGLGSLLATLIGGSAAAAAVGGEAPIGLTNEGLIMAKLDQILEKLDKVLALAEKDGDDEARKTASLQMMLSQQISSTAAIRPLTGVNFDWKEEQRVMAEDTRVQEELLDDKTRRNMIAEMQETKPKVFRMSTANGESVAYRLEKTRSVDGLTYDIVRLANAIRTLPVRAWEVHLLNLHDVHPEMAAAVRAQLTGSSYRLYSIGCVVAKT